MESTAQKCGDCPLRAKYDQKPKSFAGRFWRWHINFCPGWKAYFFSLTPDEKALIREQYHYKADCLRGSLLLIGPEHTIYVPAY
jgi:hypothetical protein